MNSQTTYRGYRFPPDIISHAVWLYHHIEDLLAERGIIVTYESIRCDSARATPISFASARTIGGYVVMDEAMIVTVQSERHYLWRAVDQDDNVIDILA